MKIAAQNISKRYIYDWIIRDFSYSFDFGSITGVSGINGSGKSTLLKILAGYLSPSKGVVSYTSAEDTDVPRDDIFKYVALAAPYTELISEFHLREMFDFHSQHKQMKGNITFDDFKSILDLNVSDTKKIGYYSSGMHQKLQLCLAMLSDTPILLLDEPTSYLDDINKAWFLEVLSQNIAQRTTVIASNEQYDFKLCGSVVEL